MIRSVVVFLFLCNAYFAFAQYSVSGKILDNEGNPLIGANIIIENSDIGTTSGIDGDFSIRGLDEGNCILKVSYVGFETFRHEFYLSHDHHIDLSLKRSSVLGEEVIIRATRAESTIPVAYTNVTEEDLDLLNFGQDLPYLLSMSPSLVTTSDAGTGIGYTGFRIRGTDANRINITINGIPLNDAESHGVFWVNMPDFASSLESVQIQRGVGTSTNGAGAFGATINMQTNILKQDPYAEVNSSFGSFYTIKNTLTAGTGLIRDRLSFDLRLSKINSDGYIDRGWSDLKSFFVSGGYYTEKCIMKMNIFSGKEQTYQAWYGVPSYLLDSVRTYNPAGKYTGPDGEPRYYDNETDNYQQDHYQFFFSHRLGRSLTMNAGLHYTYGRGYYEEFREDRNLEDYKLDTLVLGDTTIRSTDLIRQKWLDNDFYGVTFSLNYKHNRSDLTIGGAWNKYDGRHFGKVIWARFMSDGMKDHEWYRGTGIKTDFNVFGKYNYLLTDGLSLYLDMQFRRIEHTIDGIDDDQRDISQSHIFNFWNPKAGIFYEPNDHHDIYFMYAVANREPNRSNYTDSDPEGIQPKPERLNDIEAGYRFQYKSLIAGINFYYMYYKDQLILTGEINDVGAAIMTNVDNSTRKGMELIFEWKIIKALSWNFNTTWSESLIHDFTEYVDEYDANWNPAGQRAENLGKTNIAFSPQIIANSEIQINPLKDFSLVLTSNYVGKQYIDNTSNDDRVLDPYFTGHFKIQYSFHTKLIRNIDLHLLINNITNAKYESNAWVYSYYFNGNRQMEDGYFPQAGIHFLTGISLLF